MPSQATLTTSGDTKGSLEHERDCSELMGRFTNSTVPPRRLVWWHELLPSLPEHADRRADRWKVAARFKSENYHLWLRPDRIFNIKDIRLPMGKTTKAFFVEVDKGTMPLERPRLDQSSILRKFICYSQTYLSRKHISCFGWRGFRVLFITTTAQRRDNMRAVFRKYSVAKYQDLLAHQKFFLFADWATITAHENIYDVPWMLADGTTVKLFD